MGLADNLSSATTTLQGRPAHCAHHQAWFAFPYDDLCRHARRLMHGDHGLMPPAVLVHETWIRLAESKLALHDRAHLIALAVRTMHQVRDDARRQSAALKRGGGFMRIDLDVEQITVVRSCGDRLDLLHALELLGTRHVRRARVFHLHHFEGLEFAEIAHELALCPRTVARDWNAACGWLRQHLQAGRPG
ncbi:ECF-type sigma factor [Dokdonella sp.]|uniref:ECF-type sigma factor n=1 Tax=Dokdonella sp. TaxID=2291710 RepID=UPI0031C42558|nr:ECF-type sigma factor [Dokdonella sp.]